MLAIIIPAYNEETAIDTVLKSLPTEIMGIKTVSVVVDDGSSDRTFETARKRANYTLRHTINLGQGAAISTGFEFAKQLDCKYLVTIDADGQHDPADICNLLEPILNNKADIVNGSRMIKTDGMPLFKVFANKGMNLITFLFYGIWISDSQSGMRAYNSNAFNKIKINSLGHEVCSEIIGEVKRNKLKLVEVPIKTIYSKYSIRKGQNWLNFINIFTRLITIKFTDKK